MPFNPDRTPTLRHSLAAIAACALLLSGCNLGCMLAPCDGSLEVGVLVKDPSGAAITGVHVTVLGYDGETDANGCVEIDGIYHPASIFSDPDLSLNAERTGYKSFGERRKMGAYRIDVTLQPASSSKPSAAVWTPATESTSLACTGDAPAQP